MSKVSANLRNPTRSFISSILRSNMAPPPVHIGAERSGHHIKQILRKSSCRARAARRYWGRSEPQALEEHTQMASDIFAKIGDIKGESLDDKHKDEIEVLSFSWGVTNTSPAQSGGGAGAGKATFQDLSIVHRIDKASPRLMEACATGTH